MCNISGLIEYNIVRSGTIYVFYESVATLTFKNSLEEIVFRFYNFLKHFLIRHKPKKHRFHDV